MSMKCNLFGKENKKSKIFCMEEKIWGAQK